MKIKNSKKISQDTPIFSYGDLATILYFLHFPVIKIKSYVGKIFYDTFQSVLFTIGFIEYFDKDLKTFREKLRSVANFIIYSGYINDCHKFISVEEHKEFKEHILSVNYEYNVCKILKKYKKKTT